MTDYLKKLKPKLKMDSYKINIFGLSHLRRKFSEMLLRKVADKNNPENWTWTPNNPEKIKQMAEEVQAERQAVNYSVITNYTPNESTQKVLLIFSVGNLSFSLIKHLQEYSIKFFFLDYGHFLLQGNLEISLSNAIAETKMLKINNVVLNLNDVAAVLWNPPRHLSPLMDFEMLPKFGKRQAFLFRKRWVQFLKELPQLMSDKVVWIPGDPFSGAQEWQNKLGEYNLAKSIGFKIPAVIFTNDADALKIFAKEYGNKLLLREFSTPPFSFPPIPLQIDKISLKNLNTSPCCFQQYIDKKYELRVVVLFDKIFPCKIYSQDSALTKADWRVHDDAHVKWELLDKLPEDIYTKIMLFRKSLNLNWCSIDMIYGTDNEYYFLEANRPGAHYWLDPFVGLDITEKIVEELVRLNLVEMLEVMENI